MSLLRPHYMAQVAKGLISYDSAQEAVLCHFERIAQALSERGTRWHWARAPLIQGLYLYGSVGSGKTYLLDLFYTHLPIEQKKRLHLHHFLQLVDEALRGLQGQRNPLQLLARQWAKTTRVLCFDEFIVDDIAHAMILANLLDALIKAGVVLLATSNTAPNLLYLDGLQRARFLPAIALIEAHCEVLSLSSQRDYRLGHEDVYPSYYSPCSIDNRQLMQAQFQQLSGTMSSSTEVLVQGRQIPCVYIAEKGIWFDFNVLCNIPRSQLDYLELANRFKVIFVSDVPALSDDSSVMALLLMHLVDVIYDARLCLVLCAQTSLEQIYPHHHRLPAFDRTLSRLTEMQSAYYQMQCLS